MWAQRVGRYCSQDTAKGEPKGSVNPPHKSRHKDAATLEAKPGGAIVAKPTLELHSSIRYYTSIEPQASPENV